MRWVARALLLLALGAAVGAAPRAVEAHAAVVSSSPAPGERLTAAPGLVVMAFTEPVNARLSRAAVTAPDGQRFEGAATGERELQVRLDTNAPGVYSVEWTTVSLVDGHALRGGFTFGVGVAPPSAEAGDDAAAGPGPLDLAVALARALEYAGLLAAGGLLLLRALSRRDGGLAWVRPRPWRPLALALASGCAVVAGEALAAAPGPSAAALVDYLSSGTPGAVRLARLAAEALALAVGAAAPAGAAPFLVLALVALAAGGHAAATTPAWLGVAADALHLLTAALWAGGILALAGLRPPGGWRGPAGGRLLERFSPVALAAFALTVAFGLVRAFQELADPGDLVSTAYGLVLNAKVVLVLAMVPFSLVAWRARAVRLRAEAGLAVAVLGAAALLAAFPLPPARLGEAEAARGAPPAEAAALPQPGDLTMAEAAGATIVGLTLRPGAPGRNEALVYVMPLQGAAAAQGLPVELSVAGRALATRPCGPTCRSADLELRGGERVAVRVAGPEGGTAAFALPDLPAPDGAALLARAQERMHGLRAYRVDEVLGPREPPARTLYTFQAPDRARIGAESGPEIVWVGRDRYQRDRADGPWRSERLASGLTVPSFTWDGPGGPGSQPYLAPRLVGAVPLDGVDTRAVSFFTEIGQLPAWFRLWVDADGLVRRAEMRAQGHVMDQRYHDLDAPLAVQPPAAAPPVDAAGSGAPAAPAAGAAPAPPATAATAPAARGEGRPRSALPEAGDLTLGGNAGEVLVGLTLRPGGPGANTALVYLLPPSREDPALPAELGVGDRRIDLLACGPTCRTGRLEVRGGERIEVRVPDSAGARGGTAVFALPPLPAPEGAGLLDRAQRRMHALRTYRVDEWLGPADLPGLPRTYSALAYEAPDRMRLEVDNGFQRIWVGDTRYARDRPEGAWRVEGVGPRAVAPRFDWDPAGAATVAPREVGEETVDGVATRAVAFFEPLGASPAWFRLWVDAAGLVRRARMDTGGAHFMEDHFHGFDAPVAVEPPAT